MRSARSPRRDGSRPSVSGDEAGQSAVEATGVSVAVAAADSEGEVGVVPHATSRSVRVRPARILAPISALAKRGRDYGAGFMRTDPYHPVEQIGQRLLGQLLVVGCLELCVTKGFFCRLMRFIVRQRQQTMFDGEAVQIPVFSVRAQAVNHAIPPRIVVLRQAAEVTGTGERRVERGDGSLGMAAPVQLEHTDQVEEALRSEE